MIAMDAPLASIWSLPLVPITVTFAAFQFASAVHSRFNFNPLLNPIATSIGMIIVALELSGAGYEDYSAATQWLQILLGPAVVALAIPLHAHWSKIRAIVLPVTGALVVGSLSGVISAVEIARALGASHDTLIAIAPKSVTTAIAIVLSANHGGDPSLTAAIVLATGILGACIGPELLAAFRLSEPCALGFAMGVTAHAVGTSRALQVCTEAGAFSALALGLNGIVTSFLLV